MNMPSRCPICNQSLKNEFIADVSKKEFLSKVCSSISHRAQFISPLNSHNQVELISLKLPTLPNIYWNLTNQTSYLNENFKITPIAFSTPNFSNLSSLRKKIQILLTFS